MLTLKCSALEKVFWQSLQPTFLTPDDMGSAMVTTAGVLGRDSWDGVWGIVATASGEFGASVEALDSSAGNTSSPSR